MVAPAVDLIGLFRAEFVLCRGLAADMLEREYYTTLEVITAF